MLWPGMKRPCSDCPFKKRAKPGSLNGVAPGVLLSMVKGGFEQPCTETVDYEDSNWFGGLDEAQYCAGAYIFLANIDHDGEIHYELPESGSVFADEESFLAWHEDNDDDDF